MHTQIKENTNQSPDKMSLDNGYFSGDNLEALEEAGIDAYVASGRERKDDNRDLHECRRKIKKSDFTYNETEDSFTCPQGHTLRVRSNNKDGTKIYRVLDGACTSCIYRDRCCKSKKGTARTIATDGKEPLRQEMVEKMRLKSSVQTYRNRKKIVEPVFGQIKNSGFRKFRVRGSTKVAGEFSLACIAHNVKKIIRAVQGGKVCLGVDGFTPCVM